jgi:small subunit ribosomal protein S3Ae
MVKAKVIKKEWYPVLAPKIFGNMVLGETYVYEPEQMVGKRMTKNLMSLTNDIKRQNISINFKVANVQNGKALTDVIGYYMVQSSVRRLIRRNIEKIDMSFLCKTSDNKNLQIKPLLVTRSATTGSVATKIRRNAQDFLVKYISSISYDNLLNDMITHKMQNFLRKDMNKIYPLRVCEIRSMEIVDLEKKEEAKKKIESSKKEKLARKAEERKDAEKNQEKAGKAKESKDTEKKEEKVEESKDQPQKEEKATESKDTPVKEEKTEQKA